MATIQSKRGLAASWASTNPVLAAGEWGLETDTGKTKIGNGTSAWNSLPYKDVDVSGLQATSEKGATNGYAGLDANAKVPTAQLPNATTEVVGMIEVATDAEVTTGTDTSRAVTPAQLATKQSTSQKNAANGYAGLDSSSKVAAANLPTASETVAGIIEIATDTEASTGTDTTRAVNSKQLAVVKNAIPTVSGVYVPLTGGTMTGILYGQSNTSYTTAQVRNIYATTTDLTANSSSLTSGRICLVYE